MPRTLSTTPEASRKALLYHFCRLQLPAVTMTPAVFGRHLHRAFELYRGKAGTAAAWDVYLDNFYPLDWFVASACLEGDGQAWETLFAARTSRADCLLVDALRARAVRLYPRDEERQENAVTEFWGHLLVHDNPDSLPILARYDGQRPLVPWLIRVFQNEHVSRLRHHGMERMLPDDELAGMWPAATEGRWHEAFCLAAREWIGQLSDNELLILGLRLRHRLSQREAARLLGVHEGTISRQTTQLRDRCLESVGQKLIAQGWTGDDLSQLVRDEMGNLLMDEPRLSADNLARLLRNRNR